MKPRLFSMGIGDDPESSISQMQADMNKLDPVPKSSKPEHKQKEHRAARTKYGPRRTHHNNQKSERPGNFQKKEHLGSPKPDPVSTAIKQPHNHEGKSIGRRPEEVEIYFARFLKTIKLQPVGCRKFCIKRNGELVLWPNTDIPVNFPKKDFAKEVIRRIFKDFGIELNVTKGPDHQDYRGE